ncbi:MAG: TIM barrel protein [Verrucomicrobiae bacterium]|nr:TIM barrel protein [Verrucomicrobiae bacterium]
MTHQLSATSSRRQFLSLSAGLAGAALTTSLSSEKASAVEPPKRAGQPSMRLSLAAYSFRDAFKDPDTMDMPKFIDYCADQALDGAELTSYYFPKDADDAYYIGLKRHAFLRGIAVSGTAVGNNFALPEGPALDQQMADVKSWIDRAAVLGAPHIRVFAGAPKDIEHGLAVKNCIASLEECCDYAGSKGIFLGLENHGGIVAEVDAMLEIIHGVKSPWLGVNLDTGNFHTDDPYADLAKVAPWAVNVQVKVEMKPRGSSKPVAADLPRLGTILRNANYQGFVVLEHEAKEDPFKTVPSYLDQLRKVISA